MSNSLAFLSAESSKSSRANRHSDIRPVFEDAGFECVLCLSARAADIGPNPDFSTSRICRCRRCGLIATSPVPSDAELENLYRWQYRQVRREAPNRAYLRDLDARAEAQLKFARGYGAIDLLNARVLDVGCSAGSFLKTCSRSAGSLIGFEPDQLMRRTARGRLPQSARVHETLFRDDRLSARTFDLIAASHVLEHVPQPVAFVSSLCGLLSEGGALMIEVPNEDLLTVGNAVTSRWRGRMHLYFFSPDSLRATIEAAGGRVVRLATFGARLASAGAADRTSTFKGRFRKLLEGSSDPSLMQGFDRLRNLPKAHSRRRLMAIEQGLDGKYLRVLVQKKVQKKVQKNSSRPASAKSRSA